MLTNRLRTIMKIILLLLGGGFLLMSGYAAAGQKSTELVYFSNQMASTNIYTLSAGTCGGSTPTISSGMKAKHISLAADTYPCTKSFEINSKIVTVNFDENGAEISGDVWDILSVVKVTGTGIKDNPLTFTDQSKLSYTIINKSQQDLYMNPGTCNAGSPTMKPGETPHGFEFPVPCNIELVVGGNPPTTEQISFDTSGADKASLDVIAKALGPTIEAVTTKNSVTFEPAPGPGPETKLLAGINLSNDEIGAGWTDFMQGDGSHGPDYGSGGGSLNSYILPCQFFSNVLGWWPAGPEGSPQPYNPGCEGEKQYSFSGLGMKLVRLPMRIDYLFNTVSFAQITQLTVAQLANTANLDYLKTLAYQIQTILTKQPNSYLILDNHSYLRWNPNSAAGSGNQIVNKDEMSKIWQATIQVLKNKLSVKEGYLVSNHLWFELANEPHDLASGVSFQQCEDTEIVKSKFGDDKHSCEDHEQVLSSMLGGIAGVRAESVKNKIILSGSDWSGLHSWEGYNPGKLQNNSAVFTKDSVKDPNFAFDLHQYFDANSAGAGNYSSGCDNKWASPDGFRQNDLETWMTQNNFQVIVGEFGWPSEQKYADKEWSWSMTTCTDDANKLLNVMKGNTAAWSSDSSGGGETAGFIGWTYWATGPDLDNSGLNNANSKDKDSSQLLTLCKEENGCTLSSTSLK